MTIKLWRTDFPEWYAAASKDDALACIREMTGFGEDEMKEAEEDLEEVPDKCLDELMFFEEDGSKRSFREELANLKASGEKFPCWFAGRE